MGEDANAGPPAAESRPALARTRWLGVAFWVGFTSLVYEVASAKILFLFFVENTHAVALTLAAFLAGLAFSSLYFSRRAGHDARQGRRVLVVLQLAAAAYAFGVLRHYEIIPRVVDATHALGGDRAAGAAKILFVFVYLFFPGFFVGGAFPILSGMYLSSRETGARDTGVVYFWDTLGAIVGALVAGFLLVPYLGLSRALIVPVAINLLIVVALLERLWTRALAGASVAAVALFGVLAHPRSDDVAAPDSDHAVPLSDRFGTVLFSEPSPFGTVRVGEGAHHVKGNRALFINFRDMCHSEMDESEVALAETTTWQLQDGAHVLNVGLGCGFTAGNIVKSKRVASLEIAEINPVVVRAAREMFGAYNFRVLEQKKTHLFVQDGAEHLRQAADASYDAVVIDIEEPTIVHSSPLYTREYMQIIRTKLKPDGVLALWAIGAEPYYAKVMYNTVAAVFSHTYARVVAGNLHIYGSMRSLDVRLAGGPEQGEVKRVLASPAKEINTIENRALERHFDIRRVFDLPRGYEEPDFTPLERARAKDAG